jgi:hypothetical protein
VSLVAGILGFFVCLFLDPVGVKSVLLLGDGHIAGDDLITALGVGEPSREDVALTVGGGKQTVAASRLDIHRFFRDTAAVGVKMQCDKEWCHAYFLLIITKIPRPKMTTAGTTVSTMVY